jgi:hypothetical protein
MEEEPKPGTSINNLLPSEPDTTTNHWTSKTQVEPRTCKSGQPTQDGGRSLSTKVSTSATSSRPISASMFTKVKMLKDKKLLHTTDIMVLIRDGRFFIPIRLSLRPKDSMRNLDSTSIDHSTLSQNSHSTELLSALVPTTLSLRDGETMLPNNSSSSMKRPRPLDPRPGPTMVWKFNLMVAQAILE